ncbi:MAG: hypothetical protein WBK91_02645 [Alphaproteobacteria bacterium]
MPYVKLRAMTNLFQYTMLLVACVALSGCAETKWLNSLTGEPDESIGQNRMGIPRIDSRGAQWPNLSTVPPRPDNVPPLSARQQQAGQLGQDRTDGLTLLQTRNVPGEPGQSTVDFAPPASVPPIGAPTPLIGLERAVRSSAP